EPGANDTGANQPGNRQSARHRHPGRARLSFGAGLFELSAAAALCVRCPAVSVARLSDRRRSALVRVRSVLRLARCLSDVVLLFAVGAVYLAEPGAPRRPPPSI